MRYFISFSYDGSKYKGYQKQPRMKTIQGELEKALKKINSNKKVNVCATGRTDAGVHALNQKAHFDLLNNVPVDKLRNSLNSLLPDDIYVKGIVIVEDTFHARFNAKAKEYIYKINLGTYNPIEKDYVYQYNKKLDINEMSRALKYIEGRHDFRSFVKVDEEKDNYEREIIQTSIIRDPKNINLITISILGTGFMRYMVRNIVGLLIEIGSGKRKSEDVIQILESKDRKESGVCAKACGLYLKDVYY